MKTRNLMLGSVLCVGLFISGVTVAQERHPNLAEAQHLIDQAIGKIDTAQADTHQHLGGHAQKAKELLAQAKEEIRAAVEDADHGR